MTRRAALILGSNGPASLSPLKYAISDCEALERVLGLPTYAFEIQRVDKGVSAKDARDAIEEFCQGFESDDVALMYFSGHGILREGSLRLLWHETDFRRILNTALNASAIFDAMRSCRAANKLLILDCCHAGATIPANAKGQPLSFSDLAPSLPTETFELLLASGHLEQAREFEDVGGGFLTQALCNVLRDRSRAAGHRATLEAVAESIRHQVFEYNRTNKHDRVPEPRLFGQRIGSFSFAKPFGPWVPYFIAHADIEFALLPLRAGSGEAWVVGRTPVTNAQYARLGKAPKGEDFDRKSQSWRGPFEPLVDQRFSDPNQPVVCVSLKNASDFSSSVARRHSGPLSSVSLVPTEVWEFAAGIRHQDDVNTSQQVRVDTGIFEANAPAPVSYTPERINHFGISDLFGNVWEWCAHEFWDDDVDHDYSDKLSISRIQSISISADPEDREWKKNFHIDLRGGSFLDSKHVATRPLRATEIPGGVSCRHSDLGFRLAGRIAIAKLPAEYQQRLHTTPIYEGEERRAFPFLGGRLR